MKCPECGGEEGIDATPCIRFRTCHNDYVLRCPCGKQWRDGRAHRIRDPKARERVRKKWSNVTFVKSAARKRLEEIGDKGK